MDAFAGRNALRAATFEVHNASGLGFLKRRRLLKAVEDNPYLMDMVLDEIMPKFELALSQGYGADELNSETPILDKFGLLLKWLMENRQQILEFTFAIIDKIVSVVEMFS